MAAREFVWGEPRRRRAPARLRVRVTSLGDEHRRPPREDLRVNAQLEAQAVLDQTGGGRRRGLRPVRCSRSMKSSSYWSAHLPQLARMVEKEYGVSSGVQYLEKFHHWRVSLPNKTSAAHEGKQARYLDHLLREMDVPARDVNGLSASLFENFVHGAPPFAPLLFVDLGVLAAIGLSAAAAGYPGRGGPS